MANDEDETNYILTEGSKTGESSSIRSSAAAPTVSDPRLVALARFLARRAAESDFAQHLERLRRDDDSGGSKGRNP